LPAKRRLPPVEMERTGRMPVVRATYERIAAPHGWLGRASWTEGAWEAWLARPGVHAFIARVAGEIAGQVEVETRPGGDVEIVVFGLVPEFVGKGFGGPLLTEAVRLAWKITSPDGSSARRVWLHTSSRDHPHAMTNYRRRGFHEVRRERRRREVPG
jgi:GNAT superfamily N-acetyltransferase